MLGRGLFQFKDNHVQMIPGAEKLSSIYPVMIFPDSNEKKFLSNTVIIGKNGMYQWNGRSLLPIQGELKLFNDISSAIRLSKNVIAIGTEGNGLVVCDLSGNILKVFNKSSGLIDNTVNNIYRDSQNGLWLSLSKGLSRIEFPSPLSFFNDRNGLEGVVAGINEYHQQLYAGTSSEGLYVYDMKSDGPFKKEPHWEQVFGPAACH